MNETSSRSHLIFFIYICLKNINTDEITYGRIAFIDLAGSERLVRVRNDPKIYLEGLSINESLQCFGNVIETLISLPEGHKPRHELYRSHKVCEILTSFIGGDSKSLMMLTMSPCSTDLLETLDTL